MPGKAIIYDGAGRPTKATVEDGGLLTSILSCPPLLPQMCKIWSRFLTDDGTEAGSHDLGIDGSVNPVPFWAPADSDNDIYITKLNFIMGYGASAPLYDFADSGAPLANGVEISYYDSKEVQTVIANILQNYDFLRYALSDGIIATNWELRSLGALNDYGYLCSIDLAKIMPPLGIKLNRGSSERINILIRDDCTDADFFDCRVFGFERFK